MVPREGLRFTPEKEEMAISFFSTSPNVKSRFITLIYIWAESIVSNEGRGGS